jgi:hypothetical protein
VIAAGAGAGFGIAAVAGAFTGTSASTASSVGFVPGCPQPLYTADGNLSPLFCKIDNPRALKFYARITPRLFGLGRSAPPGQVVLALRADHKHATNPQLCSAYKLLAWRWHWHFGVDPVAAATGVRCQ